MKLRFLILGFALFACASIASAREVVTDNLNVSETREAHPENNSIVSESELTEEAQPAQLFALAPNIDDNELLRLNKTKTTGTYQSPEQLFAKAKKVRKTGWIVGGTCAAAGIIAGIVLHETTRYNGVWDSTTHTYRGGGYDDAQTWGIAGGCVIAGAAVAIGCNLYANSLQNKAYSMATYTAPIIEDDIMNIGANKLTAGVSLMCNQFTHTRGLGMSLKLNF